ncbi:hypothetical protein THII_0508 [Thioploca ingrica]|uniref:Swt1-like HEPN domain-containing protein n=1 Tax=Thioploca ingrica TaxID=40754 RepID=A0A090AIZ0_9GAMM|nr:hypothetical protein THII_0508 [Thioploca ingrica]
MEFSIHDLCEVASLGLSQQSAYPDENKKIKIKKLSLLNNSVIQCQFYPYAEESIDIKNEIAFIMDFLASFFRAEFRLKNIQNFAVQAYSEEDVEIMYALSSLQAADWISEGRAIEWLRNTLFQENTVDHRMMIAKRQISWLENSLREVIAKICTQNFGNNWWNNCVDSALNKKLPKNVSHQNLTIREWLNNTYIVDLKNIIIKQWDKFKSIFPINKIDFETILETLNIIRRDEAHNREITDDKIKQLDEIYHKIMGNIGTAYPELVPQYLVENWRSGVTNIIEEYKQNQIIINKGESLPNAIMQTQIMVRRLKDIELKLQSIIVPPLKQQLHYAIP